MQGIGRRAPSPPAEGKIREAAAKELPLFSGRTTDLKQASSGPPSIETSPKKKER